MQEKECGFMNERRKLIIHGTIAIAIGFILALLPMLNIQTSSSSISGTHGGLSTGALDFMGDTAITRAWSRDHGMTLQANHVTLEQMVDANLGQHDFFISDTRLIGDVLNTTQHWNSARIGVSPLVILAWNEVRDTLVSNGIAATLDSRVHHLNMHKFIQLINTSNWDDLNPELPRVPVNILAPDPVLTGTGFTYAEILLMTLAGVEQPTRDDALRHGDEIVSLLQHNNLTEQEVLRRFLERQSPLVALPENMIIAFVRANPQVWEEHLNGRITVLYPTPTVWMEYSFHPSDTSTNWSARSSFNQAVWDTASLLWEDFGIRDGTWRKNIDALHLVRLGIIPEVPSASSFAGFQTTTRLYEVLREGRR